ncbi:hypothetical protein BG011_007761 [Mortierella polycephala]|uniref:C2H2-type domain-containing protein n=1 Tax=Mortierella polycephala TaxID=41804 RepID=A0A9P6QA87_9FUNG|nr:hypothetical protein BG011_007761 [Mortierella polycephala]
MQSPSTVMPSQQQQSQQLYHSPQQPQQHSHYTYKSSPMSQQQQNLEQIQEETAMESIMAGMESGEYFSQLQLQSPQLPQATFSMQQQQQQQQQSQPQLTTPMMTPQYDFANNAVSVSTPLLASQSQAIFDMSGTGGSTMAATPTIPSSALLPSSMDSASNYGYPQFSSSTNPLFSSPPAMSSSGTFSPTMSNNMPSYFTHQPAPATHHHHHQYFSNNIIIPPGGAMQSSPPTLSTINNAQMMQEGDSVMVAGSGINGQEDSKSWSWDSYPSTNPTPSAEILMQQQHQQEQFDLSQQVYQQSQDQLQSPSMDAIGSMVGVQSDYASTTPPLTPQRHHRLFHSQSQPGLRNLQQQQLQQQQIQQNFRRRQHSVHFPGEFLSGDLSNMRTTRHVSLPVGSYSAPIPSLASLSEMMRDSPSGAVLDAATNGANLAETTTLLSMSLPTSTHGFSFLDNPPPPMHQHHQHFIPMSPPLSLTDPSIISTPATPKSRSRAGSKSRSRPNSASSVSARNASAPYSPSISNSAAVANSRSPSLVPLSPIPPFKLGSGTDPDATGPPTPAYETGLIVVPGAVGAAGAAIGAATATGTGATAAGTTGGTGGKARRVSRSKAPGKSRSRSSTVTSNSALGASSESTNILNSPFSLVLSEQDEKTLQGLAEQAAETNMPAGEDIDTFQLDAAVQLHQHQQQYQSMDPSVFERSLMRDVDESLEEGIDAEGVDADGADVGDESAMNGIAAGTGTHQSTSSAASSSKSSSPAPTMTSGKPIPCPIPSCTKSFTRPFNLNAHVKSHDTAKPYGCHLCSRVFSRKHDLQRHIRVHTGSKPYVCVNCQKAFARTDALCRHYKVEEACRMFMQQDEVRKQAQQQVQQQLHQEQVELQQAQQAHAEAKAKAQAEAQAQGQQFMMQSTMNTPTGMEIAESLNSGTGNSSEINIGGVENMDKLSSVMSMTAPMVVSIEQDQMQQQQQQQQQYLALPRMDIATVATPAAAANHHEQDQPQP